MHAWVISTSFHRACKVISKLGKLLHKCNAMQINCLDFNSNLKLVHSSIILIVGISVIFKSLITSKDTKYFVSN